MIVAIEGLDGAGKTTVAKNIASKLNMIYKEYPVKDLLGLSKEEYLKKFDELEEYGDSLLIAQFLSLGFYVSDKNNDYIFDRHILSNFFYNGNKKTLLFFNSLIKCDRVPDLTIVLKCDAEERRRRITERSKNDSDLTKDLFAQDRKYKKMIDFAEIYDLPYVEINTDNRSIEYVQELCEMVIKNYKTILNEDSKIKKNHLHVLQEFVRKMGPQEERK